MALLMLKEKIIWAVDLAQNPVEANNIVNELKIWSTRLGYKVQPVSIVSKSLGNIQKLFGPSQGKDIKKIARSAMKKYMSNFEIKEFLPAELVFTTAFSKSGIVDELSKYAERKCGQLIVANTRAKRNWRFLRFGTFAENLIATSKIPLLLMNPSVKTTGKISSILFPTDFSTESMGALAKIEPWAKAFHSKILVFDRISDTKFLSDLDSFSRLKNREGDGTGMKLEKLRLMRGKEVVKQLESRHIESTLAVRKKNYDLPTDILDLAKKNKVGMIAIGSSRGPISQALFGSVATDILEQAQCPVLVFHKSIPLMQQYSTFIKTSKNTPLMISRPGSV